MNDPYGSFRLNFEQQHKRAKDLLKAARAGERDALRRFTRSPPKLAEAQYLIARDLRFENWAALKRHVAAMTQQRAALGGSPLDIPQRTMHIRCGSDLKVPLQQAGFQGDFYEHSFPYLAAPVHEGPDCLAERARFIIEAYGDPHQPPLNYQAVVAGLQRDERRLDECADYERVVIWSEGDTYDQLVLVRLLGHFARHRAPPVLELINSGDFPGSVRFIGLGQLPPEALRMLWASRTVATSRHLQLGLAAWQALINPDPRPLANLMRTGTPPLPLLAPALHRHLRELPSITHGLSLTEELTLRLLAEGPHRLMRLIGRMTYDTDPLPGQGDMNVRNRALAMLAAREPVFRSSPGLDLEGRSRPPWSDVLEITELGRAVLSGQVDFRSLNPALRWVGGVPIGQGHADWRWNELSLEPVLRPQGPSTS